MRACLRVKGPYLCLCICVHTAVDFNLRPISCITSLKYRSFSLIECISEMTAELHYKNMPMQYKDIFTRKFHWKKKMIFFLNIFAQNIHCGYTKAVLMSTHNVCFGSKIRKLGIPLKTPVFLYKSGVQGGLHVFLM